MNWIKVYYRGYNVFWQPRTGKMYTEKAGQWGFSGTHNFEERIYDRATAIAVAKAWIDS
jgi:hypothetical protein